VTGSANALSRRIFIGVLSGAAAGIFFGDKTSVLQPIADGFVRLLQMTVLPYVTVSIISGLGSLDPAAARRLGARIGAVLLLLWVIALAWALMVTWIFPTHESASFFSATMIEDRERFDFLGLYIPTNPFNSLANSIVPAVVLFSIAVGIALIGVPDKERLIDVLKVANRAISRATDFIVSLTPYGVFAIAAVVSGTLGFETLRKLEVYLVSYVGMAMLLSLWVLPAIVSALTPIPYRAVMSRTRDALVLAFMTTSLFAVLPLLTEHVKALLREYTPPDRLDESLPDVIVPTSFNFPHAGKLLSLSFVLFAAWFSDTAVPGTGYLRLAGTGLVVMFGNVNAAIPFLLDMLRIPADTFRLFVASGVINARFGTLVAAMHTVTIATVGTCAVTGTLRRDPRRLVRLGAITVAVTAVTVGGLHALLAYELKTPYDKDQVLASMQAVRGDSNSRVFRFGEQPAALPPVTTTVVERVQARKTIRVGYFDDSLPFAYFNRAGQLVGFDVEMADQFGADLGVAVEFVPIDRSVFTTGVDPSRCDVIMSGVVVTADRTLTVQFTTPYLDETLALIVPDYSAAKFSEWGDIRAMGRIRVGVPSGPYFIRKVKEELPNAEIVTFDTIDAMFQPREPPLDALVATAERGSAYTILHPAYSAVVPKPRPVKVPLAYVVAGRDPELTTVLNTWIDLKRKDGTIDQLFAHWILGEQATVAEPRWSVIRNVLHLVP
jgi:Na+/H+-dicarboxylate symporter/ABC-type amino acid transport substrate-binding protein